MEDYEVEHEFPGLGHRTMRLNARQVFYEGGADTTILLGIEDVTRQRTLEREMEELLRQKDVLLEEMQHRIANSLQIIASIILMKARTVQSEETRLHLHDAHSRVMSIASCRRDLPILARCERPSDSVLSFEASHPGGFAQGPEEKNGRAGFPAGLVTLMSCVSLQRARAALGPRGPEPPLVSGGGMSTHRSR